VISILEKTVTDVRRGEFFFMVIWWKNQSKMSVEGGLFFHRVKEFCPLGAAYGCEKAEDVKG
jgi:hypothetical protein